MLLDNLFILIAQAWISTGYARHHHHHHKIKNTSPAIEYGIAELKDRPHHQHHHKTKRAHSLDHDFFSDIEWQSKWDIYKSLHGKRYDSNEDELRFGIYKTTVKKIYKFNSEDHSYTQGENQFTDMTSEERKSLGRPTQLRDLPLNYSKIDDILSNFTAPDTVDWTKHPGVVTNVKNQRKCGCCWAIALAGAIEGQYAQGVSFSGMQICDCARPMEGCNGWYPDHAAKDYLLQPDVYIAREDVYPPYEPFNHTCRYAPHMRASAVKVKAFYVPNREASLKTAVAQNGPILVAIDGSGRFEDYKRGIYYNKNCKEDYDSLDHDMLVVGYGTEGKKDYWKVKASYGPNWGEGGYIRMARNRKNNCGIATSPVRIEIQK